MVLLFLLCPPPLKAWFRLNEISTSIRICTIFSLTIPQIITVIIEYNYHIWKFIDLNLRLQPIYENIESELMSAFRTITDGKTWSVSKQKCSLLFIYLLPPHFSPFSTWCFFFFFVIRIVLLKLCKSCFLTPFFFKIVNFISLFLILLVTLVVPLLPTCSIRK